MNITAVAAGSAFITLRDSSTNELFTFNVIAKQVVLGEVHEDGVVNSMDASDVLTEYARVMSESPAKFTPFQQKAADVDGNGVINSMDASYILTYYAYCMANPDSSMTMAEYMNKYKT